MKVASIETELLINEIIKQIEIIKKLNPGIENIQEPKKRDGKLKKVLISNRGEIAKRFFLSLKEESIPSVAVVTDPDRGQSWYETADEVIFIGNAMNYVRIPTIIAAAILSKSNAIYPGYGFLSENPDFVDSIKIASEYFQREIIFMGPDSSIMRKVGNKLDARNLAKQYGVSLFEGTDSIQSLEQAYTEAERIGYPVIVKLNAGGGGKGMQAVFKKEDLAPAIESCRRIGKTLYDDDSFYLEKFIVNPVHIEVQIFNGLAVGLRKCAVQRRNQKIIEETGDTFLSNYTKLSFLAAAENMARISGYSNGGGAGTVEFLYDPDTDTYGFLEMNTRLQVEHPVTDQTLGIDLAKWQILLFDGREHEIPYEKVLERRFINQEHTIECRVYAEDPENQYSPTPGKIEDLDLPTFNGVRCDFGFRRGDRILPDYDPMIGKVIAWGSTRKEAVVRMERALNELYIRGVTSNLNQLLRIIRSDVFRKGDYSNRILLDYQELCYPVLEENLLIQCSIFSAITEYVRTIQEKVNELFQNRDLEVILNKAELFQLPDSYDAELYGNKYLIQFLQNGLEEFEVFVNEIYFGNIKFLPSLSIGDDYTVRYQNKTYTIRVDRRHAYNIVRFNDDEGKVHYYKVRISSKGDTGKKDPIGLIRSPIQGTFVKFMDDVRIGSKVKAGQPIIILSAMKMESTIKSPIDGTIEYLIENGDPNRLILSKTADGKIIGKSISEGEVLFYVKPDKIEVSNENETTYTKIHINPTTDNQEKLDYFIVSKKEEEIQSNIDTLFPSIIRILENIYLGFNIENKNLVNKIIHILKTLPKNYDISKIFNEKLFLDLILTYSEIKRLFSPLIVTKSSYFRETFRLFNNWENFSYQPSANYLFVINEIFKRYDVTDWRSTSEENQRISKKAFYFILRAFQATREYIEPILLILDIIGGFKRPSNALKNTLRKFVNQEEAEQDLTIAEKITETLSKLGISRWSIELVYWVSRKYLQDLRKITSDPLYYPHISREEIRKNIEESLKQPYNDLIPDNLIIKPLTRKVLEKKIQFLGNRYTIQRLYSPISNVLIYLLKEGEKEFYFVFGIVEKVIPTYDKDGNLVGSENVEIANINAVKVLNSYQSINKKHGNYLDIIVVDEELILDLSSESKIIFNYDVLTNMMFRLLPFFNDPAITNNIVSVICKTPNSEELIEKQFYVTQKEKKVILNILTDENPISPYFNPKTEDTKTSHVYRLGKWPVELWVRECFDVGSYKEIRIPGIDYQNTPDEVIPVGSKIYEGKMNKIPAIFYLKDSRISGGATGDLEGLKYVAACWLASVKGYPLYVFNDGAGANIRQGMVSLNRAAEGFFMNALIGGNYSPKKIYEYIKIHDDGKILEVINKINQMLSIKEEELPTTPNTFIVAVGVGSSTGLDVYGSSQAAIQVMVDDEQSYRVLTGSAVIKSVTGEDLTNYEIGGARVMSRLTGTVDLVARSNIHLLVILKSIHELFAKGQKLQTIQRKPIDYKTKLNPDDVLNADIIRANSDHGKYIPFKEEYYGSGALIGGFAKIAGRPILIMGPRNRFGLRSYQSLLRAIDLLITARKLNSDQIIVVGDEWFIETPRTDSLTLRARQDFLKLMTIKAGTRIHIATTVRGLQKIMLHSGADALIFIRNRSFSEKEEEFIKNSSTHVVHSYEEAFDLSLKIIQLLSEKNESEKIIPPSKEPIIPENPAMPFDIIENVISRVFDEGTFIEWWKEMNDPQKGPSLITGFAKLNGKTVGILADQPAILGGAPDAPGTEKFRIFTELIERNKVPLIMISNAPGFLPGTKQERLRIQQIGGRSLDVNVLSTIPVVSVTLNQNYGGRQIHAFSKFLRPCIISFSLKNSILAVMGADSAFDLFYGKKYNELKSQGKHQEAEEMRSNYIKDFNEKAKAENDAYKTNVLDFMIEDIKELRQALIKGLDMAIEKNKLLENVIC
ncbi:MAG: carbamoyl-phosphate synthase subunit L [Leptospiraceae bacterium]|nr:carbamoyl-phosphate synthase subunit L [Leptospiraceae bacterium]MDW7976608.1 carboxyl transferase domain-containing protein [Leptospiraceae bacterium]